MMSLDAVMKEYGEALEDYIDARVAIRIEQALKHTTIGEVKP